MSEAAPPSPLAPSVSPLIEADPNSLNELIQQRLDDIFNKKPPFSDEDLIIMVRYYQKERLRFMQESALKELKPKATRRTAPKSVAEALSSSEDLL